jgi:hypothetical protein
VVLLRGSVPFFLQDRQCPHLCPWPELSTVEDGCAGGDEHFVFKDSPCNGAFGPIRQKFPMSTACLLAREAFIECHCITNRISGWKASTCTSFPALSLLGEDKRQPS